MAWRTGANADPQCQPFVIAEGLLIREPMYPAMRHKGAVGVLGPRLSRLEALGRDDSRAVHDEIKCDALSFVFLV
jgi:hypothetical protein